MNSCQLKNISDLIFLCLKEECDGILVDLEDHVEVQGMTISPENTSYLLSYLNLLNER